MDDLKILVGCHKPCECPDIVKKHKDIYIPILAGAAESNIEPFWPGMIRDDIMNNISWLNPYYSEYTCLYWAWKNYDMIGNPEYFGFAQYHRFLDPDLFLNKLHPNKVYIYMINTYVSVYDHYIVSESDKDKLKITSSILNDHFSDNLFDVFLSLDGYPAYTLFVAHRDVFYNLMKFLDVFIKAYCSHIDFDDKFFVRNCRYFAFMLERLTGYFFIHNYYHKTIELNPVNLILT